MLFTHRHHDWPIWMRDHSTMPFVLIKGVGWAYYKTWHILGICQLMNEKRAARIMRVHPTLVVYMDSAFTVRVGGFP